jgi:hypothetical protein
MNHFLLLVRLCIYLKVLLLFNHCNSIQTQYLTANNNTSNSYNESEYDLDNLDELNFRFNGSIMTSDNLIKLRHSLLAYYDKNTRPILDSSRPIRIKFSISIVQINGLNEAFQTMMSSLQS